MSWEANIVLYHCNDEKRCQRFLKSDTYMIISPEDGDWLGQGMYFWDNLGNAKYWEYNKQRKAPDVKHLIIKARVSLENVLDLTDIEVCKSLDNLWNSLQAKYKGKPNYDPKPRLGKKLNILYKSFPDFIENYKVIKVLGKYINTPPNGFIEYSPKEERIEPILSAKVIYNVKRKEAILERIACNEVDGNETR